MLFNVIFRKCIQTLANLEVGYLYILSLQHPATLWEGVRGLMLLLMHCCRESWNSQQQLLSII